MAETDSKAPRREFDINISAWGDDSYLFEGVYSDLVDYGIIDGETRVPLRPHGWNLEYITDLPGHPFASVRISMTRRGKLRVLMPKAEWARRDCRFRRFIQQILSPSS